MWYGASALRIEFCVPSHCRCFAFIAFPLNFIEFRVQVDGPLGIVRLEPPDQCRYFGNGQTLQERDVQCLLQVESTSLNNRFLKDHQELGHR